MVADTDVGDVSRRNQDRESAVAVFLGSVNSQEILGLSGRTVFPLINDKVNPCHLLDAAGGAVCGVGLLLLLLWVGCRR
jgi:hypothetical protein